MSEHSPGVQRGCCIRARRDPREHCSSLFTFHMGNRPRQEEAWSSSRSLKKQGGAFQGAVASVGCVTPSVLCNLSGPRTGSLPCPGPCLSLGCYRTKYHRLSSLDNRNCFSHSNGSPRSSYLQIQFLVRTHFLTYRWPSLHCPHTVKKDCLSQISFIRRLVPFMRALPS